MNWLFLRGKMERYSECNWKSLAECTDMWTHLFNGLLGVNDFGIISYSNDDKVTWLTYNFKELRVQGFKILPYCDSTIPDIIVARGGFKEYAHILRLYPSTKKVYYGANHGCIPNDGIKYDLILCDTEKQVHKCVKRGLNGKLFIKPAAPQFKPMSISKRYDVGFVAIHPGDDRKNVQWVYKTVPKDLKVLQMGHAIKSPSNVKVKYIKHENMCKAINKCRVVIAPYKGADSCPRIISEALACGVPVVALDSCQFWRDKYPVDVILKKDFWNVVNERIKGDNSALIGIYNKELSIQMASKYLREVIDEVCDI